MKNSNQKIGGYAILETVFYILLFAVLSVAVINSLITMTRAFKETAINHELSQGASIMDRISREIRSGDSINSISTNSIKVNKTGGTITFTKSGSNINLLEDDVLVGVLNTSNISIDSLSFTEITTTKSAGVKIVLTISSTHDALNRQETFYDTIVLRGGY